MGKIHLIKIGIAAIVLTTGFTGFLFTRTPEMQTAAPLKTPENVPDAKSEVAGYKNWTKVNRKPHFLEYVPGTQCAGRADPQKVVPQEADPQKVNPQKVIDSENLHNKYINVYVNLIGKDEMLTKKNPNFPVGTVVVKEKLSSPDSRSPELLTVMIKREKGFNSEVGDWEFLTFNGEATEITSQGKLQNCQTCHLDYEHTNFITREYLPDDIRGKLR